PVSVAAISIQFPYPELMVLLYRQADPAAIRRKSGIVRVAGSFPKKFGIRSIGSSYEHRTEIRINNRASVRQPAGIRHHFISDSLRRATEDRYRPDRSFETFISQAGFDGQ